MRTIFFSSEFGLIDEWKHKHAIEFFISCYDIETLNLELQKHQNSLVIVDYDSVASEFNKVIQSGIIHPYTIVLERSPEIATGKMLLSHGIKAYGNSRMLTLHYEQMTKTVTNNKIWTYPEFTASLSQENAQVTLNEDSITLLQNRLSPKEIEVVYFILDGLTNDAIASKLKITNRTVKAHVSSIFKKLHVNDRISLVLLLK